jgi:hypothetical protein
MKKQKSISRIFAGIAGRRKSISEEGISLSMSNAK